MSGFIPIDSLLSTISGKYSSLFDPSGMSGNSRWSTGGNFNLGGPNWLGYVIGGASQGYGRGGYQPFGIFTDQPSGALKTQVDNYLSKPKPAPAPTPTASPTKYVNGVATDYTPTPEPNRNKDAGAGFVQGPGEGFASVPADHQPSANTPTSTGLSVVSNANNQIGRPYTWGGTTREGGFDCSGLVQWSYAQAGISVPRTAQQQFDFTQRIDAGNLKPGDLVFFENTYPSSEQITHVGIYIGNGKMINAPSEGHPVGIYPVFSGYWGDHYAGAGRVTGNAPAAVAAPGPVKGQMDANNFVAPSGSGFVTVVAGQPVGTFSSQSDAENAYNSASAGW